MGVLRELFHCGAKISTATAPIGVTPGIVCKRRDISASLETASIVLLRAEMRIVS
jgi:hypothetical protein